MENNKIKVYVKTNGNHEIIDVNSEVFIKDYTNMPLPKLTILKNLYLRMMVNRIINMTTKKLWR